MEQFTVQKSLINWSGMETPSILLQQAFCYTHRFLPFKQNYSSDLPHARLFSFETKIPQKSIFAHSCFLLY